MTTDPMDVRDWQQDQINKLSPYDDDRAAEIEQRIRDQGTTPLREQSARRMTLKRRWVR